MMRLIRILRISLYFFSLEGLILSVIELILIGISLSMDAFAVSICKGLSVGKIRVIVQIAIAHNIFPLVRFLALYAKHARIASK